jgi:hypothetical protein
MLRAIAFCIDELGQVASFEGATLVRVYQRCLGSWEAVRDVPLALDIGALGVALKDCAALVGEEIGSRLQADLESLGLRVWELPGDPQELAEVVWKDDFPVLAPPQQLA